MIQREVDPLTGGRRDDVLVGADDLRALDLADGGPASATARYAAA
jgi:hypothetical protein